MLILYEREVTDMGYNNYNNNNYNNNSYNHNNRNNNSNRKSSYQKAEPLPYTKLSNKNYVDLAEKVIKHIKDTEKPANIITTTKLRSILSLNSEIYNMVTHDSKEKLSEEIEAKIQYLKVKVVYEMGREGTKTSYILFARYLEALVAFRKYIIGKDK